MNNNLKQAKKDLKAFAKKTKDIKYSESLLFSYLMTGMVTFSVGMNTSSDVLYEKTNKELIMSADRSRVAIKKTRKENEETLEELNLELVQLMEQGDHVVKSPWSNWQYGINFYYSEWNGVYKGRGDKQAKYYYNTLFQRPNWKVRNALDPATENNAKGAPITPGNDSLANWRSRGLMTGRAGIEKNTSVWSSVNNRDFWGFVSPLKIQEPINEVEILAHISPKEVTKQVTPLQISEPVINDVSAPVINPQVNEPSQPPKINLPKRPNLAIPGEPELNINPSINTLQVNKVGNITVNPGEVKPVDFMLSPSGLSEKYNFHRDSQNQYNINNTTVTVTKDSTYHGKDYISTWGRVKGLDGVDTSVNVNGEDTRAFMIDEGIRDDDTEIKPFRYTGTINLNKSKNVGIDVQGTHTDYSVNSAVNPGYSSVSSVANIKVINQGTIIGNSGAGIKNQVAFGFNNFDTSSNNTRTQMINDGGTITLNAPESAGIQLRPEDPESSGNSSEKQGLNMMTGENSGTITLNGSGSFGILTVKNKNLTVYETNPNSKALANSRNYSSEYKITSLEGGQIASRAQKEYMSKIENSGTITMTGDNSVGVGLLNSIQSVVVNGNVNIKSKGSVGVYTEVATRPVEAGKFDDHALENTTGSIVGTKTVEVGANVTLDNSSQGSYGLRNAASEIKFINPATGQSESHKTSGSITLKSGGKVNVGGKNNYGVVANGEKYDKYVKESAGAYPVAKNKEKGTLVNLETGEKTVGDVDVVGKVVIDEGAEVKVTGEQSIGYALLSGEGSNAGTISVEGNTKNNVNPANFEGSIGFYGKKGTFLNTGTISASGKVAHGVVVKTSDMTFNNAGKITVDSPATATGNIGIYSDGDATVNIGKGSTLEIKDNSVGLYSAVAGRFNNTFVNKGRMNVSLGKKSTFAYLDGDSTDVTVNMGSFLNNGIKGINLTAMGESSSLVYARNKAKAVLNEDFDITKGSANSTIALLGSDDSEVSISSGRTLKTNTNVALAAVGGSTATNEGNIISTREPVAATDKGGIGIYAADNNSKAINAGNAAITMKGKEAVGMFGKNISNFENIGTITMEKEKSAGMYGEIDGTNTLNIENKKDINTKGKGSVGIFAKNGTSAASNLKVKNEGGTITLEGEESIGIYAPKSTVEKVGTVTIGDSVNKSVGVYVSKGGKVSDTSTGTINLGTSGANIAYYVKNKDTSLEGANIGTVSGYGVGVYLEGDTKVSGDTAKLTGTSPKLDFTTGSTKGNGIVGLYLKGTTDISAYSNDIKVGDTVEGANPKYAIGIYADGQGTTDSPATVYDIAANVTAGKKGVGIFVDNKSNIKYTGNMNMGEEGTGFFIAENGKVELTNNTISMNGGVVAYAAENSEFNGGTSTIEMTKSGIGVFGKKGSKVNVDSWTFNNHGNEAEEVRLEEGQSVISGDKDLKPKMVLSHVINGETYLTAGKTVKSVADGAIQPEQNIGLMAEGMKNPTAPGTLTWKNVNFEIENYGTLDLSAAKKSTGIYANSARVLNDGEIKVGENSTGIYGFYDANTRKFDGVTLNKVEVETTANSKISLNKNSVGMYLKDAEKVTNLGGSIESAAGSEKNVGIYTTNADKKLVMDSKANITLGDGSVGIYSKGKGTVAGDRNIVTNTGNITVEKKLTGSPSVGIYAENTNLENDSNVTVGEDGIAFYGKHANITAKGIANFNNKGVLAYLESSEFTSYLGNLGATQNTMLYLKDSKANLAGAGTKVDMTVADDYTGAYVEGNSEISGLKTVRLGRNSNGFYLKNAIFTMTAEEILSTRENARGILAMNTDLTNNSKISLSGNNSIGIYSNATSPKNIINNAPMTLSGSKTLGVFLKGDQTFTNNADLTLGDSANSLEPTIGVYTTEGLSTINHNSGNIEVGKKSLGIYSVNDSGVSINGGKIHVKDEAIGIYKKGGTVTVNGELAVDNHVSTVKDTEPVAVYGVNGTTVNDYASKVSIGEKSYGFILSNSDPSKVNTYTNTNAGTVSLANDSTYLYSTGRANVANNRSINSNNADHLIGFYIKGNNSGRGNFVNNGILDFSTGKGNIGIYAPNSVAVNSGTGKIMVGATDDRDSAGNLYSDFSKVVYGIGMAADNGGSIKNDGEIRLYGNKSIGMYGSGNGTVVENNGKILLDGSRATDTNKIQGMTGVYVDNGAKFVNRGTIQTTDSYAGRDGKVNPNVSGLTGVAVMNGSTLINEASGKILIDADNSYGVIIRGKVNSDGTVNYAVIKNYGEIKVRGTGTYGISWKDVTPEQIKELENQINSKLTSDPQGQELRGSTGTDKGIGGVNIAIKDGKPVFMRNGVPVSDSEVEQIGKIIGKGSNLGLSDIGFYIDTLGRTKPINIDGAVPPINSQLIIGTEYSERTNSKYWFVKDDVIKPFLNQVQGSNYKLKSIAGSLTWMATPVLDSNDQIVGVAMAKIPYTSFTTKSDNAYNFLDGLEQRYDKNTLNSREKQVFNKLNSIGKNEQVLFYQAIDEMMGHQYGNTQQRINSTGNILDKEFSYLRNEWRNPTKQNNKIKVFGSKDEYRTDTAGIIDYTSNSYGVAYVHEDEKIKLGNSSGWYTGIVTNRFKFKDIGKSIENQNMIKAGIFKTMAPANDHNGSLRWTIAGDVFAGINNMKRRYLVVDDIFEAKSDYHSYGAALKTNLSYDIRMSERTHLRPYGALKMEYGRFNDIKEDRGQVRLEVDGNNYYSIKPEVGIEFKYVQPVAEKANFSVGLAAAYENELGKVGDTNNRGRVGYTTANWFGIRGEKDDRHGNGKFDLNIGLDNTKFGITVNGGYDTKGKNARGGIGFRVIY
ncbi:autotransporter-associated N-terminal domain-containing protein [Leptotrichia trevisanii]|uniref:Autotransporter beta-domain protein n=1 Tax=Leptotrichia trevisanii TaxID=109328 RepID=A0A510K287_9FUSO|nr:autotransporter-associated N-terminal domain-containing protein [Leptotrichia trevisanii]BBM45778.1 hypothetical protein JMUB3870_1898 [Leptotrichia trevisanii]